jgi:hypothetical protein
MKRYLKFAASFWMGAFLVAGSFASAQTTPAVKTKKKSAGTAANTPVTNLSPAQSDSGAAPSASTAAATAGAETATEATVTAHDQPAGTTTAAPRTMTTPDKRTVIIPQI